MASCILWENAERSVTLLDVPRSIEAAQGTLSRLHRIKSTRPLKEPFPSNEPRSDAARARLAHTSNWTGLDEQRCRLLVDALQEVRSKYAGPWHLPRLYDSEPPPKKRKADPDEGVSAGSLDALLRDLASGEQDITSTLTFSANHERDDERESTLSSLALQSNPTDDTATLAVMTCGRSTPFHIPPLSSHFIGDCKSPRLFHNAVRNQAQDEGSRRRFDLIVMDPPWPNRSVKRTHIAASYNTVPWLADIHSLLFGIDLDLLLDDKGLLAVWITNKPAIRTLVLHLFANLGVTLEEEWTWLKTTADGQSVLPIESMWRKPYEVLLLGRKTDWRDSQPQQTVKQKVLLGMPDLHSRKPCLRELFEPKLPQHYRALEIFARHLVSGWHSWGDQCIKFNSTELWESDEEGHSRSTLNEGLEGKA